jgi:hypothetical protein
MANGMAGDLAVKLKAQNSKSQISSKIQPSNAKFREWFGREPTEPRGDLKLDPWSLEFLWSFEL